MVLVIRDSWRISLLILTEFKIKTKFADGSLSNFWRFKEIQGKSTTWRNKLIRKKYFVRCASPWSKDGIFAVTNISVEILMYIRIFILAKAAFFWEGIQQSTIYINHKKSEQSKQDKYFDKTNEKSGNYCK